MDAGRAEPSVDWRRNYSLLLGLERLLSEDEPHLADGTLLNPHQVDALSGTLIALTSELEESCARQRRWPQATGDPARWPGATISMRTTVQASLARRDRRRAARRRGAARDEPADEEPEGSDPTRSRSTGTRPRRPRRRPRRTPRSEDPGADRRFWFEHATGAGKTVAALGFVEASRTGGILILTHRRNLVDQFLGELRTRGYKRPHRPGAAQERWRRARRRAGP